MSNQNGKAIGQGMTFLAWIIFLGMLTYGFNKTLEHQNNPNQNVTSRINNDVAEVKLIQNRHGHYLASGQINHTPVTFMLDTGATLISVPAGLADDLQLLKGFPSQSRTANGTITVYDTRLNSVGIGAIELNNIRASINPHMTGDVILLGMSFMKHLEMTQKGNELILRY